MRHRPLGNKVIVEPLDGRGQVRGGIHIPDNAREQQEAREGIVVELGTGKKLRDGRVLPFAVEIGDRVLLPKYGGEGIKFNGRQYYVVDADEIMGILE